MDADQTIKTRKLTLQDIIKIIETGETEQFVGLEETAYFEFRELSYNTTIQGEAKYKAQIELVKDITSVANSGGGLICIGLEPKRKSSVNIEYVNSVSGIKEEDVNMQSWSAILGDWVIPRFSADYLKFGFIGQEKKIFWILVKNAQEIGQFPFILVKDQFTPEGGINIKGKIFSYYTRDGAENIILSANQIQKYIADGLRDEDVDNAKPKADITQISADVQSISLKLDSLNSQIGTLSDLSVNQMDLDETKKKIISYVSTKIGGNSGYFYIYAIPTSSLEIKNFWGQDEKSVSYTIKHTPTLRNMGWSLEVANTEYPYIQGNSWEIMNGDRKILLTKRNGEIFTAGAIDGFLDWSMEREPVNELKLVNAFALTEYVDIFFRFFTKFKQDFDLKSDYIIKTGFVIPTDTKLAMQRPAHIGSLFSDTSQPIMQKSWTFNIKADDSRLPTSIAGEVVVEINATGFGWPAKTPYPYLKEGSEGYEVDEDFYRKNVTV